MIRVLLADDHTIFRQGVVRLLKDVSTLEVVAEASTGPETLSAALEHEPDVVLLDISMPGRGASETLQELKRRVPKARVLMLTAQPEDHYAIRLLKQGASGYITKDTPVDEMLAAVKKVAQGGRYITAELAERIAFSIGPEAELKPHHQLSDREYQVLVLICSGKTPTQIADELNLSVKTISTYRSRILVKMGFKNNAEMLVYGVREGLVT